MKMQSLTNSPAKPSFGLHIEDRSNFFTSVKNSHLPAEQQSRLKNAIVLINSILPNDSIVLEKYTKHKGLNNNSVYLAKLKSTGFKVAEAEDCGWCKFAIYLAGKLTELAKRVN